MRIAIKERRNGSETQKGRRGAGALGHKSSLHCDLTCLAEQDIL